MASDLCGLGVWSSGTGVEGDTRSRPGILALQDPPAVGVDGDQGECWSGLAPRPPTVVLSGKPDRRVPVRPQQGPPLERRWKTTARSERRRRNGTFISNSGRGPDASRPSPSPRRLPPEVAQPCQHDANQQDPADAQIP